jgi:hypothetical protein
MSRATDVITELSERGELDDELLLECARGIGCRISSRRPEARKALQRHEGSAYLPLDNHSCLLLYLLLLRLLILLFSLRLLHLTVQIKAIPQIAYADNQYH